MSEPSLEYFIAIAEECNISQAAKRLNISQQGLSNYLQKLEAHYHTQLITRKPAMHLTEAGTLVYESACQVHRIKQLLRTNVEHITAAHTTISIGIYAPNASLLLDFVPLVEFGKKYPHISFNVTEDSNQVLREQLSAGKLDLIIGAYRDSMSFPDFEVQKLYTNQEYIIISSTLLRQYFPDMTEQKLQELQHGARLEEFQKVPLVMPPANCGFSKTVSTYCAENHLKLNQIGEISNRYLSNSMVFDGVVFGFCDERYLSHLQASRPLSQPHEIYAFPIVSPGIQNNVGLMYRKSAKHPAYFLELIDSILEQNAANNPPSA